MARAVLVEMPAPAAQYTAKDATIEFSPGREIQTGDVTQNSKLTLIYDPARLPYIRNYHNGLPAWDIVGSVRFLPGLEMFSASVVQKTEMVNGNIRIVDPPIALPFSVTVPPDAMGVEMWFVNTGLYGDKAWDSRYGQNYAFKVAQAGPAQPVSFRAGAMRDPSMVNVLNWSVDKERLPIGSDGSQLETHLSLTAWVRNVQYQKNVWIDFHVFDEADHLVHSQTIPLTYSQSGGGGGDLFNLDQSIFKGSGGVPGSVWPRPDARLLQFRLYYEVAGQVFTDGYLHEQTLQADAEVPVGLAVAA